MTKSMPVRVWLVLLLALSSLLVTKTHAEEAGGENAAAAQAAPPAQDVFDLLDSNHDGRMDRQEFKQAVDQFEDFLRHNPNVERTGWFARPAAGSVKKKDLSFWSGFTSAVGLIIATEIGDKTFFIAAVLSMKNDRRAIFGGAILALIAMTILSTLMGLILPQFLDRKYTHVMAGILFLYFGGRLIYESQGMAAHKVSEELEEVEEELMHTGKKDEENNDGGDDIDASDTDGGKAVDPENQMRNRGGFSPAGVTKNNSSNSSKKRRKGPLKKSFVSLLLQSFTLTFLAEWGDRSQIATIALAAAKNPYGVTIGGCLGHSLCTGMAVLGGRMLASRISEKTVSQYGGALFLLFGIHSLFFES